MIYAVGDSNKGFYSNAKCIIATLGVYLLDLFTTPVQRRFNDVLPTTFPPQTTGGPDLLLKASFKAVCRKKERAGRSWAECDTRRGRKEERKRKCDKIKASTMHTAFSSEVHVPESCCGWAACCHSPGPILNKAPCFSWLLFCCHSLYRWQSLTCVLQTAGMHTLSSKACLKVLCIKALLIGKCFSYSRH